MSKMNLLVGKVISHLKPQAELLEGASDLLCEDIHAFTLLQRHHLVGGPLLRLPQKFNHVELVWQFLQYLLQRCAHLIMQDVKGWGWFDSD